MAVTIGSNIAALRTLRSLGTVDETQRRVFERLSSGMRINRASDDAAGLSIASTLSAKSRIQGRALLNLSDGQSLLSVADSALEQLSTLQTRMAELAEQASNGSLSLSQRTSLDKEYQNLSDEIKRITTSTTFNGINLLQNSQSNRAGRSVYNADSVGGGADLLGFSAEGRYTAVYDYGTNQVAIRDSITGEVKKFSDPANGSFSSFKVTSSGDVAFSYISGSNAVLSYYSAQTGSVRELARTNQSLDFAAIAVSADGSTLAFSSYSTFVNGGTLSQVSGGANAKFNTVNLNSGVVRTSTTVQPNINGIAISADGRYVSSYNTSAGFYFGDFGASTGPITLQSYLPSSAKGVFGITDSGVAYITRGTEIRAFDIKTGTNTVLNASVNGVATSFNMSLDGTSLYFANSASAFKFDVATGTVITLASNLAGTSAYRQISRDGGKVTQFDNNEIIEYDVSAGDTTIDLEAGYGSSGNIKTTIQSAMSAIRGLGSYSLKYSALAKEALDQLRANLTTLSQARGVIGAGQSRISVAQQLSASMRDEYTAAASRITDVDVAEESANLIRANTLKQASAALLAQANQQPALALLLLGK